MSVEVFLGQARAQLLAVGIIRPNDDAIHINQYMQQVPLPCAICFNAKYNSLE